VDGVPVFVTGERVREAARRSSAPLDELWHAMDDRPAAEAAAEICQSRVCARSPYSADWKFFFSIPPGGTTLEVGAGFGDDSLDLAGKSGAAIAIVPSLANARIVRKHLRERAGREWPVAVMADVSRLPLADGSVHAVAFEDAAAAGFGVSRRALSGIAAEWKRVLAPGGVVFLGVANRLHRLPGLGRLRAAFRARPRPEPLNRQVKRWAALGGRGRLGVRRTVRTMTGLGFRPPSVYAPLPDENDAQVVIPVDDAQVVRYFLNNLIRRNSRSVRAALRTAHLLVDLGVFGRLVPYYYLVFRTDA
jgi:SAM-dependent methyltransferase